MYLPSSTDLAELQRVFRLLQGGNAISTGSPTASNAVSRRYQNVSGNLQPNTGVTSRITYHFEFRKDADGIIVDNEGRAVEFDYTIKELA